MSKRNKASMLLLGIIIGIFIATVFWGASDGLSKNWINLISAVGTFLAVIVSLWATNDSKKVKFNPKVELELGKPQSPTINSIKYRIYGFNSGDTGDAIKTIHFSFQNKGRYVELFSKEQIINIDAGKFIDFSGEDEINFQSKFFKINTAEKLTPYVTGKYKSVYYELITYSGRIYKDYIDVVVHSKPKWRVVPFNERNFGIFGIDGQILLNPKYLKDPSTKSKFLVDEQLLEAGGQIAYSLFRDEETANEVLKQYIKEQNDKY